jgi:glycopeptide antibiotics resistance protein
VLLVLWGLFIVYATTLPFDFSASDELVASRLQRLWQHPLRGGSWRDVNSNVLFFVPWGFLLAVWRGERGARFTSTVILALASACILSAAVETVQLRALHRTASCIDVITNTFGSTVGALVGWPFVRWLWPAVAARLRLFVVRRPLAACALCVVVGLVLAGVAPFQLRLPIWEVKDALRHARFIPFGPARTTPDPRFTPWSWVRELCIWLLVGGLFGLAAREGGAEQTRARISATLSATGLCLAIQALHLLIRGRDLDMTFVLVALAGSVLGAAQTSRLAVRDACRFIVPALAIWAVAVLLTAWAPLRFVWRDLRVWQTEWLVPFWTYFFSRSLDDLADVVGQALNFVPLGALLAARSWRTSLPAVVVIGLAAGALLEFGQVFVPHRRADITDVLSAGAGAAAGWGLWRWGESCRSSSRGNVKYRVSAASGLDR